MSATPEEQIVTTIMAKHSYEPKFLISIQYKDFIKEMADALTQAIDEAVKAERNRNSYLARSFYPKHPYLKNICSKIACAILKDEVSDE